MTVEQKIIDWVLSALGALAGFSVFEWRIDPLDEVAELPALVVSDPLNRATPEDRREKTLNLPIQIIAAAGEPPATVRAYKAQVLNALNPMPEQVDEVQEVYFDESASLVDQEEITLSGAALSFGVVYRTEDYNQI